MREMGALEIAKIIHADPKNAALPVIALGDGSQRALMEAFKLVVTITSIAAARPRLSLRTCATSSPAKPRLPAHADACAGRYQPQRQPHPHRSARSAADAPHAHQTGALHINAANADAVLFFDAGEIVTPNAAASLATKPSCTSSKTCM